MESVSRRSQKGVEEYRHNIKLLKYHLKKEEKLNETLRYKQAKKTNRQAAQQQQHKKEPHPLYAMLVTVSSLSSKVRQLGLALGDVFRMADGQYRGEVTREQFMGTVARLRGNLEESQINEMFYAIDSNLNGMLSFDEYDEFLNAHGGTDNKAALAFQREAAERFLAALKKKNLRVEQIVGKMLNPLPVADISAEMKKLGLNGNHVMVLLRMWDPSQSGLIRQEALLKSMTSFKVKDERQIQNEKLQKGIKELCVLFREKKVNPMEIFEGSDMDGREGVSVAQLQEGLRGLLPEETPYQIKKWVNLVNLNNDSQISREQFVSAIRSFYSLQQIDSFSNQYDKLHPKLKKALEEEVPAEKTINDLSIFIEDNGLTKTELFYRIDLSGNGTIDKAELCEGLKSLGIGMGMVGKVLAVFDRDASGEIGLEQWLSILGEDLEMEDVDIPEDKQKAKAQSKTQQSPKKQDTKKESKKSGKKEVKEEKKVEPLPKQPPKASKEPQKKPTMISKASKNVKTDEMQKQPAKQQEDGKKPLKDQDKNKATTIKSSQKSVHQSKKQVKIVKKQSVKQQALKKFGDEMGVEEEMKQTYSQEEVSIDDLQRQVGQVFAKSPKKTKELFSKCSRNGKKGLNQRELAQFLKELKLKTPYDQKHVKKAFEDNCSNSGLITTEWFDKLVEKYELNPKQETGKEQNMIKLSTNTITSKIPKVLDDKVEDEEYGASEFDIGEDEAGNGKGNKDATEIVRGKDSPHFAQLTQAPTLQAQTISDEGYKLRKLINCEQQIALLQGKYTTTANSLKKNKKPFQDKSFPAVLSSLTHLPPNQSQIPDVSLLKWKHYKQLYKSPELFKDSISPNDIKQGTLGDCYFLCSLAALAEYKNLIQRLFQYYDTENGYFLVWICIDGAWRLIELDGYIPVAPTGEHPAFSHGEQGELWVMLLEKAYAKAYGNYEKINGGQPYEAIKDLTGAPGQSFCHRREQVKADELWRKLDGANREQFIMTCGTDVDSSGSIKMEGHSQSITKEGLVLGHAYSILDVREYKGQRLIQLRNPWGETEWKGDWSDQSKKWTEQARKELGYSVMAEDGIFWMPFQAYFQKYNTTAINYLRPNYFYSSQFHKAAKSIVLSIPEGSISHGFVIASQQDHRKDGLPVNTPYKMNHIITLQYKKGKLVRQISNEKYLYQREGSAQITAAVDAQIIVLINLELPADINICTYADSRFEFEVDQQEDRMLQYVEDVALMESRAKNIQTTPNMFKSWMASVGEYAFLVFKSIAKKAISFSVKLPAPKNLELKGKGKQISMKIQSGEARSVRGKIINLKDSYSFGPLEFSIDEI